MSDSLVAVVNGTHMGTVLLQGDRLSFQYDPNWQTNAAAFPLSLSMPLTVREHGHRVVDAFLWDLLHAHFVFHDIRPVTLRQAVHREIATKGEEFEAANLAIRVRCANTINFAKVA